MTLVHTIIIGILQGVSELFPVSSLGHAVLIPSILRWGIDQKSESWLAFLVALHVGTAIALLIYFRDDWVSVVKAFVRSVQQGQIGSDHDERLAWMVVLGTIPTARCRARPASALTLTLRISLCGSLLSHRQWSDHVRGRAFSPATTRRAG